MAAKYIMGYISKVSGGGEKVQVSVKSNGLASSSLLPSNSGLVLVFYFSLSLHCAGRTKSDSFISEVSCMSNKFYKHYLPLRCVEMVTPRIPSLSRNSGSRHPNILERHQDGIGQGIRHL